MSDLLEGWADIDGNPEVKQTPSFVKYLLDHRKHTPDFDQYRLRENIFLFVYDEFKRNARWAHHLRNEKYMGEAISQQNTYQMKLHTPSFPIVFTPMNGNTIQNPGHIRGEMYAISPDTLLLIDKLQKNGEVFLRKDRAFRLLDQEYKTKKHKVNHPVVKAIIYVGNFAFWKDKDLTFSPSMVPNNQKNNRYYEFTMSASEAWSRESGRYRQGNMQRGWAAMTPAEREEEMNRHGWGNGYMM